MYTMTEEINSNYIAKVEGSGMPVTCGTCHRGQVSPEPFTISRRRLPCQIAPLVREGSSRNEARHALSLQRSGQFGNSIALLLMKRLAPAHVFRAGAIAGRGDALRNRWQPSPMAVATQTASKQLWGAAACATCHKEVVKDFANNPHSKPALMHAAKA